MTPEHKTFLAQVQAIAPTIFRQLNAQTARITCCETQFSQPSFDCRWHRFESRFMQIADAEGKTLEAALQNLEAAMHIRERMAA